MLTLSNQRDLTNDMLIKGIIDSVVTVNQFYNMLPFKGIQGNALAYNRESAIDTQTLVGTVNTAFSGINKKQQTFTRHSTELTTLIGDAQVNGLIQAVGSDFNDATAVQVAAKAKGIGRTFMSLLINGNEGAGFLAATDIDVVDAVALLNSVNAVLSDGSTITTANIDGATVVISEHTGGVTKPATFVDVFTSVADGVGVISSNGAEAFNFATVIASGFTGFDGLSVLATNTVAANTITSGADLDEAFNANSRLSQLDLLIDRVHDKDGMVDYMMMNSAGVRKITSAFRGVGTGFDMMDVKTSSGAVMSVQSYRGVPIFRNDFIGTGATTGFAGGDGNNSTDIYVGTLDDGSLSHGICGLTAMKSAGMQVSKLGAMEMVDADITRVKWYCGLAHFSELGLVKGQLA